MSLPFAEMPSHQNRVRPPRGGMAARAYKDAQAGQQRDQLIMEHLEYAYQILGSMTPSLPAGVDKENLKAAGVLGLIEAAQNFDASRGVSFKTFAFRRIRGAVVDELRRNSPLPQKIMNQISQVRKAVETLPPPVTPESISETTGLSVEQVDECLVAMRVAMPQSWDEFSGLADQHTTESLNPSTRMEKEEQISRLASCIEKLPERERHVIMMYHLDGLRLKEIGEVLGVSESRLSRILAKAEFRLRQYVEASET